MQSLTLPALVIRETDVGEIDKLLTLLTAEHGKMTVKVHGCRNIKSKNMACSSLFCYGNFTLTEKNGRYTVKESSLQENFFDLRMDLARLCLGNYIAEVLQTVATEENDETELLVLALNTLFTICRGEKPLSLIKAVFELRALCILGYSPDLDACTDCGKDALYPMYFDFLQAHLLCPECRMLENHTSPHAAVDRDTLSAMRYIISAPSKRIFSFSISEESLSALSEICERFLVSQTETNYKSLQFYHSLPL